jgi:uncharacterized protein YkwD
MTPSLTSSKRSKVSLLRYASIILAAAALAVVAAVGVSAVNAPSAEAALFTVKTCTGGTIELNSSEKQTLVLHNQARADRGLPRLCVHPALTKAARAHSQEMLDKDYFSHDSYNGETFEERFKRFGYAPKGYSYYTIGENIAWGSGSYGAPDGIFKSWMNSSGHKANILNRDFRQIGIEARIGSFDYKGTTYPGTTMYTVDFGTRR